MCMAFEFTNKDIISFNQEFEDGALHNEASLDFAISYAKRSENWTKSLAFLTRAILLDHVFQEGNKRTAALLIKAYAEFRGFKTHDDKLLNAIKLIIAKKITDVIRIEEMVKDVINN